MTAHHPKASMIGCQTVATPPVMPPPANRPEPAGTAALKAAIEDAKAEGRVLDPIAEYQRQVLAERNRKPGMNVISRETSESLKASLEAYHAPRIAATEGKIIAAIKAGHTTRLQIMTATGLSDSPASVRLIAMAAAKKISRSKCRPSVYSVIAARIDIAAE